MLNPGSAGERALTSKVAGLRLKQAICSPWSSPAAAAGAIRASAIPSACAQDVVRGYVSLQCARDDYGVALSPDSRASMRAATARLRQTAGPMTLRVGIDVGGTFTDVTAFDEERGEIVAIRKYLSDPGSPPR